MNVVRPHVQSVQLPVPVRADFSNRVVGDKATLVIELHRRMLEAMGRSEAEVLAQLNAVAAPFGIRFGE